MKETWKSIRGYEGLYEVSDLGRVRSLGRAVNSKNGSTQHKRVRVLTQEVTIHGYCRVRLYDKNGDSKHYAVHRVVLETFVGESPLQVNHRNEIKTDNRLENLEYVSARENCNYGTRNQRLSKSIKGKNSRPVEQLSIEGKMLARYSSREEAETVTGVSACNIGRCCTNTRETAGGYKWRNA